MNMKKIFYYLLCIFAVMPNLVLTSCSSLTEKKIKEYEAKGKHIVNIAPQADYGEINYFYYYDNSGIYFVNVSAGHEYLLVDFNKSYYPARIYLRYDYMNNESVMSAKNSIMNYFDFETHFSLSSDFRVSAFNDCALFIYQGKDKYVFFVGKPDYCYYLPDASPQYSSIHEDKRECVTITYSGNLWGEYGLEPGDDSYPRFPSKYIEPGFVYFWFKNYLPTDMFKYNVDLEISFDGTISPTKFIFPGLNKCYTIYEINNGDLLQDLSKEMDKQFEMWSSDKIENEGVNISDMITTFHNNTIKANRDYKVGNRIFLHTKLSKIIPWDINNQKYKMTFMESLNDKVTVYSNDDLFAYLDYPCYVDIMADFMGVKEDGWFIIDREYKFENAVLLFHEK